jgi:hypothetical protein
VAIGTASFTIAANGHQTVIVHLTAAGRSMLAATGKSRRLKTWASGSGVKGGWLWLKRTRHHRHKRH